MIYEYNSQIDDLITGVLLSQAKTATEANRSNTDRDSHHLLN